MRKTITWFDDLEKISNEIEKRIKKISKRLENVPEGSLRVSKAHGKNNSITRRISISNGNTFSAKTVTLLNSSPRKTTTPSCSRHLRRSRKQ